MSNPLDVSSPFTHEYQTRFGAPPSAQATEAELARLVELCKEALAERDRLRAELADAVQERDEYRKTILAMLPPEPVEDTKEELFAQLGQGPSLRELIVELEQEA